MSRMIFAACTVWTLATLSGCCIESSVPYRLGLLSSRIQSACPISFSTNCGECTDCIPCKPHTYGYKPCWDKFITEHTAQLCALNALKGYQRESGDPISHDFEYGFISAYEDLAFNRKPVPPIVPPHRYWNAYFRSCAGLPAVQEWFAGYDAGLEMGLNSGVSKFHEVYLRRGGCDAAPVSRFPGGARAVPVDPVLQQQPLLTPAPRVSVPTYTGQPPAAYEPPAGAYESQPNPFVPQGL